MERSVNNEMSSMNLPSLMNPILDIIPPGAAGPSIGVSLLGGFAGGH